MQSLRQSATMEQKKGGTAVTGMIFDIQRFSVHDGPGIRTTVFMKGCPLRCKWCHNPEGLSPAPQVQFLGEACIGCGRCGGERTREAALLCPSGALKLLGQAWSPEALLEAVLADREFYGAEGGVTFSGGECLLQYPFVAHMLRLLKERGIRTAVDTSGEVPWEAFEAVLPYCDTYLYDVKTADPELHRSCTGRDNAQILQNLRELSHRGADLWIRIPVIPGVNDSEEEIRAMGRILAPLGVRSVTLIPYHTLGQSKYATLGMSPGFDTEKSVTGTQLRELRELLRSFGLNVEER